jgi:DNA-binding GntR family transcriptional regulator
MARADTGPKKRAQSLPSKTFEALRTAIFSGRLKPGDMVRELHVAQAQRVSQATVREALAQLERDGLVTRLPNRRTSVTTFSREEVRDRLTMRIVLEELAAAQAGERMTDAEFAALSDLAAAIAKAVRSGDQYRHVLADMRFHQFIWQCSGSPVLARTLEQLTTPLFAFLSVLHQTGMYDLRGTRPHERIVESLRSGDPAHVRREIRDHIGGSYGEFLESGLPDLHAAIGERQR